MLLFIDNYVLMFIQSSNPEGVAHTLAPPIIVEVKGIGTANVIRPKVVG